VSFFPGSFLHSKETPFHQSQASLKAFHSATIIPKAMRDHHRFHRLLHITALGVVGRLMVVQISPRTMADNCKILFHRPFPSIRCVFFDFFFCSKHWGGDFFCCNFGSAGFKVFCEEFFSFFSQLCEIQRLVFLKKFLFPLCSNKVVEPRDHPAATLTCRHNPCPRNRHISLNQMIYLILMEAPCFNFLLPLPSMTILDTAT
jgi:hypothetical protein